MMVHVADAVEKKVKSGMFPTRDTAVVTVSSNCCGHFRCERNFWCPNWDKKDPNCTSVCNGLLVCLPLFHFRVPHNIDLSAAALERKLPRLRQPVRRRTFQMLLTPVSGPATAMGYRSYQQW